VTSAPGGAGVGGGRGECGLGRSVAAAAGGAEGGGPRRGRARRMGPGAGAVGAVGGGGSHCGAAGGGRLQGRDRCERNGTEKGERIDKVEERFKIKK
jgi:hypothetical protein